MLSRSNKRSNTVLIGNEVKVYTKRVRVKFGTVLPERTDVKIVIRPVLVNCIEIPQGKRTEEQRIQESS